MPLFEFECEDAECGHCFERLQKADDEDPPCPKCQGKTKRRMSRGVGLVFKGSGFYATDYKDKG